MTMTGTRSEMAANYSRVYTPSGRLAHLRAPWTARGTLCRRVADWHRNLTPADSDYSAERADRLPCPRALGDPAGVGVVAEDLDAGVLAVRQRRGVRPGVRPAGLGAIQHRCGQPVRCVGQLRPERSRPALRQDPAQVVPADRDE